MWSTEAAETRDYQITYKEFKKARYVSNRPIGCRCHLNVIWTCREGWGGMRRDKNDHLASETKSCSHDFTSSFSCMIYMIWDMPSETHHIRWGLQGCDRSLNDRTNGSNLDGDIMVTGQVFVAMCWCVFFCEDTCDLGQTCDETRLVEPISGCPFDLKWSRGRVGKCWKTFTDKMISECWWPSQRGTTESTDVWGNGNIDLSVSCHGAKNQW